MTCPAPSAGPRLIQLSNQPKEAEAQAARILLELCKRQPSVKSYTSGAPDNFGMGPDAAGILSPALTNYATTTPYNNSMVANNRKSFDDATEDRYVLNVFAFPRAKPAGGC